MARTDFTASIDNIIMALSSLDKMLDKVSPKLTDLSKSSQIGLSRVNTILSPKNMGWSAEELQNNLDRIMLIKKEMSSKSAGLENLFKPETLRAINSQLNVILDKIADMRNSLQMLNTISRGAKDIGLTGGAWPFTEQTINEYKPRSLSEEKTSKYSTFGLYNSKDRRLGIGAEAGSLGPLEIAIHELGHHIETLAKGAGVDTTSIIQANASRSDNIMPALKEKFMSAGWNENRATEAAKNAAHHMMNSTSEAFAEEFSNFVLTGKTAFPNFDKALQQIFGSLSSEMQQKIATLVNELVSTYRKQLGTDLIQGVPGTNIRQAPLLSRLSIGETTSSRGALSEKGLNITEFAKQEPDTLEQLKKSATEAEAKVVSLRSELEKLLRVATKGAMPTQEGIEKAMGTLQMGQVPQGIEVTGGGVVIIPSSKKKAILAKANEVREGIKALNEIQKAIESSVENVGTSAGIGAGDVDEIQRRAQEAFSKMPKEKSSIGNKATLEGNVEALFGQRLNFNQEQVAKMIQIVNPLMDIYNRLNFEIGELSTSYKVLTDGVIKFSIATKDSQGVVRSNEKAFAYLTKEGKVLNESEYQSLNAPDISKNLQQTFKNLNPEQVTRIKAITEEYTAVMERLGTTLTKVGSDYTVLNDGTVRFTVTMTDSTGAVSKVNAYLTKQGEILKQTTYEQLKKTEADKESAVTLEKLAAALQSSARNAVPGIGAQRADRAMGLAAKSQFKPEDLKSAYTQEPAGVTFLKFAKDAEGVVQKLEITIDRFGNVITRTNRRLLGFFDSIIKNTGELLRWSIGVGLVYGSYYRLQQMVQVAIDNEAKLADVTVTLGDAHRDLRDILDDTSKVAFATGESINEVLETYVMAYRAVGGIADETKKTASANKLLYDSTVLNKLSSLDSATAIDVLSGSLRQLQKPGEDVATAFERGTDLLDKWVMTSRKANVDLATLATAFSITSESAENSGMSIEELNAVIASLSEKIGGLGGRETGNAVRALIGGVYQQQAAEGLGKYGIAIKDTEGKMRDFLDISKDIYELYAQGIISEDQLNKIGYVLGGGVRRGQQYVAFLTDLPRVMEIVAEQAESAGSSEEALAKKMDIVKTSITNLGNATQRFSFTLGSEGGVLGATNSIIQALTALNLLLEKTTLLFGKMTIPAALLTVAGLYFRGAPGQNKLAGLSGSTGLRIGSMASTILSAIPALRGQALDEEGLTTGQTKAERMGTSFGQRVGPKTFKYGTALAFGAYPALARYGENQKAGEAIGVFAGGVIGALLTGGSPIGALIGSTAVDAILSGLKNAKGELEDLLESPYQKTEEEKKKEEEEKDTPYITALKEATSLVESAIAGNWFEKGAYASEALLANSIGKVFPSLFKVPGGQLDVGNVTTPELQAEAVRTRMSELEKEGRVDTDEYRKLREALDALTKAINLRVEQVPLELSDIGQAQGRISGNLKTGEKGIYTDYLADIQSEVRDDLRKQSLERDIKPKEYRERLEYSSALPASASALYTALYHDQVNFNKATDEGRAKLKEFSDMLMMSSTEDIESLNLLVSTVYDLDKALQELEGKEDGAITQYQGKDITKPEALQKYKDSLFELEELTGAMQREQLTLSRQKIPLPGIVGLEGYDVNEMKLIEDAAREAQDARLKTYETELPKIGIEWTPEMSKDMVDNAEPVFIYLGELLGYYLKEGITDPALWTEAAQKLEDAGTIDKEEPTKSLGYQFMDVSQSQFNAILPQYNAMRAQILAAGGESTEDTLVTYFKDANSPSLMTKDWKLVQYLLGRILEETEKGVEGLYNLPGESTFYVPSQTLEMAYNAGYNAAAGAGGGAGLGSMVSPGTTSTKTPEGGWPTSAVHPDFGKKIEEAIAVQTTTVNRFEEGTRFWLKNKGEEREKFVPYSDVLRGNYEPPKDLSTTRDEQIQKLFSDMSIIFKTLFGNMFKLPGVGAGFGMAPTAPTTTENLQSMLKNSAASEKSMTTNLKLDMTSSVQLMVDGRVLANIVKQYLWEDLIRYDTSQGTATRALMI